MRSILSTPLGKYNYNNHQSLLPKISKIIDKEKPIVNSFNNSLFHYYQDKNIFENNDLDNFEKFILESSNNYIKKVLGYKVNNTIITDCWINVCKNGGFQTKHNHANSFISGTYYLNFNKNHPPIVFHRDSEYNNNPFFQLEIKTPTEYNTGISQILNINPGTLLLWPSNLAHSYEENLGDDRVSISMNILPDSFKSSFYSFSIKK